MRFTFVAPYLGSLARIDFAEVAEIEVLGGDYVEAVEARFRELENDYENIVVMSSSASSPCVVATERVPQHSVEFYQRRGEPFRRLVWAWNSHGACAPAFM